MDGNADLFDESKIAQGQRLGKIGIGLGALAVVLDVVALLTDPLVALPSFVLAIAAIVLGVLGINRTSSGWADLSSRAVLPELAVLLGGLHFVALLVLASFRS